jgi:uncharacterized protein
MVNHINEYEGHWIGTFTGKQFHYLNPKPEEIDIIDIAHALSLNCRFCGHTKKFYSVAQHSVFVARFTKDHLAGLLHDASEAYLHDLPRPIKNDFEKYRDFEDTIQNAINKKFGIDTNTDDVKDADNRMLSTEARDLMSTTEDWREMPKPYEFKIIPTTPEESQIMFMNIFKNYCGGC